MSLVPLDGTWYQLSHVADTPEKAKLRCRCMSCHRDIMPGRVHVRYDAITNTYNLILECHGEHATYSLTVESFVGIPDGDVLALVLSPNGMAPAGGRQLGSPPPASPKRKGRLLSL